MPVIPTIDKAATFRFIMRSVISCKFREEFEGEKFNQNLPRYYGSAELQPEQRDGLNKIMSCNDCLDGMKHIHQHLHDEDLRPDDCEDDEPYKVPLAYGRNRNLALVIMVSALVTLGWSVLRGVDGGTVVPMVAAVASGLAGFFQLRRARYNRV